MPAAEARAVLRDIHKSMMILPAVEQAPVPESPEAAGRMLFAIWAPNFVSAIEKHLEATILIGGASIRARAHACRNAKKNWPTGLDEIKHSIPVDTYTNRAFLYFPGTTGVRLASAGWNVSVYGSVSPVGRASLPVPSGVRGWLDGHGGPSYERCRA